MLANFGCGNMIMSSKGAAILAPESAPMRRPKDDAKERNMQVDATQRSIVITNSDHVILPAVQVKTLAQRLFGGDAA
jgi:extracellular matrix regulatory protein A